MRDVTQPKLPPLIDDVTQQLGKKTVITKMSTSLFFFRTFSNYGVTCEFIRSARCVNNRDLLNRDIGDSTQKHVRTQRSRTDSLIESNSLKFLFIYVAYNNQNSMRFTDPGPLKSKG